MKQAMSANRAYAVASMTGGYAKGLQRAYAKEKGYLDMTITFDLTGVLTTVTLINPIAQGTGVTQRVGKKVVMKGLQFRGESRNVGPTAGRVRQAYMIVYDKRPTGTLPAITDILVTNSPVSLNNDNNAGRFRILKRVDQELLGNTVLTAGAMPALSDCSAKAEDWWLDLKSAPVTYKAGGTGTIGDIEEGALYFVCTGDSASAAGASVMDGNCRLRFLDV